MLSLCLQHNSETITHLIDQSELGTRLKLAIKKKTGLRGEGICFWEMLSVLS